MPSPRTTFCACLAASALLLLLSARPHEDVVVAPPVVVAVCVSGAARGPRALRAFAATLREHLLEPAVRRRGTRVELFAWLHDDAAERQIAALLPVVATRLSALDRLPAELRATELAAVSADHGRAATVGAAASGVNLSNTLHMLHKLRGCEWLRQQRARSSALPHALVVRIRPDLLLLEPLPLPLDALRGAGARRVWVWHCAERGVASDQLLVGAARLSERLAELYSPAALRAATARSQPPSTYPERLLWQHLLAHGFEPQPLLVRAALVADTDRYGGARSPFAKLQRDFPSAGCPYPPPAVVESSLRQATRWVNSPESYAVSPIWVE